MRFRSNDFSVELIVLGSTVSGVLFFGYGIDMSDIFNPSTLPNLAGFISVVGMAIASVYGFVRNAIRLQNLADAEAIKETWKGKYEEECRKNELLCNRYDEMKKFFEEREQEIEYLRKSIQEKFK